MFEKLHFKSGSSLNRKGLLGISVAIALSSTATYANPVDGSVIAGSADITSSGKNLNITQNSDRAVIDWRSFDIAADESTNFIQPNSSSVALNRVTNNMPTNIQGSLTANGNVILINQSGILFDSGSKVDVGGLIATTGDINNANFMNGNMKFDTSGAADATIENKGIITVKDAGLVGLAAPQVKNSGVINARLGRVNMVAGDQFTLDLYGDGLIEVGIGDNSTKQKIENTGAINAAGGKIQITAAAARNVVNSLISIKGELNAPTYAEHNGKIVITNARPKSQTQLASGQPVRKVTVEGRVTASGAQAGQSGGDVEIYGDDIDITSTATIDASGQSGGGTVLIGGDVHGTGDATTALRNIVENGADIKADATADGNGGKVIVWADDQTYFEGNISAKGGANSGDGGFVETSGERYLNFDGTVDTTALNGAIGTLLLDPTDVEITASQPDTNITSSGTTTITYQPNAANTTTYLTPTTIQNQLANTSVTVQTTGTGNLTVSSPISWSSANALTLYANNLLTINAAITDSGSGTLNLQSADIAINAAITGTSNGTMSIYQSATNSQNFCFASCGVTTGWNFSSAEASNITGFTSVTFGASSSTGTFYVGQFDWGNFQPAFRTAAAGTVTIAGAQTVQNNKGFVISSNNVNINSTISSTGTGALTIRNAVGGSTMGIGTGSTGVLNIDDTELSNISGWAGSLSFGSTSSSYRATTIDIYSSNLSSINFNSAVTFSDAPAGSSIVVRTPIVMASGKALTFTTRDMNIAADITGTGNSIIFNTDSASTIGVGTGAGGNMQLDDSELNHLIGFTTYTFGNTSNGTTSVIFKTARTWSGNVVVNTAAAGSFVVSAAQNFGVNNLTVVADAISIGANLTGTGTLTIKPVAASTTVAIGGNTGASGATQEIDNTEIGYINNQGWGSIIFGIAANTSVLNVNGATTWGSNVTFTGGAGGININAAQTMAAGKNLTISGRVVDILADLNGTSTSTLNVASDSTSTTVGLGDSAGGTLQLDTAELNHIKDGWGNLVFGTASSSNSLTAMAYTWSDNVEFRAGTGGVIISGAQNVGANNLTLTSNVQTINSTLTGTGTLTVQQAGNLASTIGGTSSSNTFFVDNTEISNFNNGNWANIILGSNTNTGQLTLAVANTWLSNMEFRNGTGTMTFSNTNDFGAKNATITTAGDVALNATNTLRGTGNLIIQPYNNATMGIGGTTTGGSINLTATEVSRIVDGWNSITFGSTTSSGAIAVQGGFTGKDNMTIQTGTGVITVSGAVAMGANNLTIITSSDLLLNSTLTGTGNLEFRSADNNISYGIGDGSSGTQNFTNAELANIIDGWNLITFGSATSSGAMDVRAYTWNDSLQLRRGSGVITFNGSQALGANSLTIVTDSNPVFASGSTINGTGALTIQQASTGTSMDVASSGSTLDISNSVLTSLGSNWSSYSFGRTDSAALLTVGAKSWSGSASFASGTGGITLTGAQTVNGNLSFYTGSTFALNYALTGSGILTIAPNSGLSMGVGTGASGSFTLTDAQMANISNTWSSVVFGSATAGAINLKNYALNGSLTIITPAQLTVSGAINVGANNLTIQTNTSPIFNSTVAGTGIFTITPLDTNTTMDVLSSGSAVDIGSSVLSALGSGWSSYVFGRTDSAALLTVGANTWNTNVTFNSGTGGITVSGAQNMGVNSLNIFSDINTINAALTGTGTLRVRTGTGANAVVGGTGSIFLTDASINNFSDGWSQIIIGSNSVGTGSLTFATSHTWNDNLQIRSNTGVITFNAGVTQDVGSNNLDINTAGDISINATANINGTGTLSITPYNNASIALGSSGGTILLSSTEIGRFTDGWGLIYIGSTSSTGNITTNSTNVTWKDNVTFATGTGAININNNQTFSGNTFTILTGGDVTFTGTISSSAGNFYITPNGNTTVGIGDGSTGVLNISTSDLSKIASNTNLIIGSATDTATMDVQAATYLGTTTLTNGGAININGQQTASNGLTLISDTLNINAPLVATTTSSKSLLKLQPLTTGHSIGLGTGSIGDLVITDAEYLMFNNGGWYNVYIGNGVVSNIDVYSSNLSQFTFSNSNALSLGTADGGNISIRTAINSTGITLTSKSLNIAADISGSGTLQISPVAHNVTMGLGDGAGGDMQLDDAELNHILDGWTVINLSSTGIGSQQITFNTAHTWTDPVVIKNGENDLVVFNGAQTFTTGNYFTIYARALTINADISGTNGSTLSILSDISESMAYGGATGTTGAALEVDDSEVAHIASKGWGGYALGWASNTSDINFNSAINWNGGLTISSLTGAINFNAAQSIGTNSMLITTGGPITINGALSGTGTFRIAPINNASIGLGDSSGGVINLSNAELDNITDGWASLTFGDNTGLGSWMDVESYTWKDPVVFETGTTAALTINGVQNFAANAVTLYTNTLILNGTIAGTGALTIRPANNANTIGVGDNAVGTLNLTNAELDNILDGWGSINIGTTSGTGAIDIRAYTWRDNIAFATQGAISVNGNQDFGSNTATLTTNSDIALNAVVTGTGALAFRQISDSIDMGIGDGTSGAIQFSNAELDNIQGTYLGSNGVSFGNNTTGNIYVNAYNWLFPVTFRSGKAGVGSVIINGQQNFAANNVTFILNASPVFNADLIGTGTLLLRQQANTTTIGFGDSAGGTVNFSDASLNHIAAGWSSIVLSSTDHAADLTIAARTWNAPLTIDGGTSAGVNGTTYITGTQNMGANNLTIVSAGDLVLTGALTGTGQLYLNPLTGFSMGLGDGASGTYNLSSAELALITDGWSSIKIGNGASTTSGIDLRAATWNDNLIIVNSGLTTINGQQNFGANNVEFDVGNTSPLFNAPMIGMGTLTFRYTSTVGNTVGIGDGTVGNKVFTDASLNGITGNWSSIIFTADAQSGTMYVAAHEWGGYNVQYYNVDGNIDFVGANTANSIFAQTTGLGGIVLDGKLTSTGTGNAMTLVTNTSFTNNYGAGALTSNNGGRWLVYSNDPANDFRNNQAYNFKLYNAGYGTYAPASVTQTGNGFIYTIAPTLTIAALDTTRPYGSNYFNYTITGYVDGDNASTALSGALSFSSAADQTTNAGATVYPFTISQNTLTSPYGYNIVISPATANLTISQALLSLNATVHDQTRQYGAANPTLTAADVTWSGFVNGDDYTDLDLVILSIANTATPYANAGTTHAITISTFNDNNYTLDLSSGVTAGTLTITKAQLTAVVNDQTRAYGAANPTLNASNITWTGFVNGENSTVIDSVGFAYANTATATANAGTTHAISISSFSDNNYSLNIPADTTDGTLSITKAQLTAVVNDQHRAYGSANPTLSANDVTWTGLVNGDTANDLDAVTLAIAGTATVTANAGTTHDISISSFTDNNYSLQQVTVVDGVLTIDKALITAVIHDQSRAYGNANPTLSATSNSDITWSGLVNGDTAADLDSVVFAYAASANSTANAGTTHAITLSSFSDNNYTMNVNTNVTPGYLTITKAQITGVINNQTRAYGAANPYLTGADITWTGLKNGENGSVIDSVAFDFHSTSTDNAGTTHAISLTSFSDNNYTVNLSTGMTNGTLTITKANLTAIVNNQLRETQTPNPTITKNDVTWIGLANGETASVLDNVALSIAGTATLDAPVGSRHAITLDSFSDNNYNLTTIVNGNLLILPNLAYTRNIISNLVTAVNNIAVAITPANVSTSTPIVTSGNSSVIIKHPNTDIEIDIDSPGSEQHEDNSADDLTNVKNKNANNNCSLSAIISNASCSFSL